MNCKLKVESSVLRCATLFICIRNFLFLGVIWQYKTLYNAILLYILRINTQSGNVRANPNISSLAQECKCQNLHAYQTPRLWKSSDNKLIIKVHRKRSALYFKSNIQLLQHQLKMENVPLKHKKRRKILVFPTGVNKLILLYNSWCLTAWLAAAKTAGHF